ncbi:response regulator [Sediminivirga luteola]|uniref:DNA-binding response regulator n=1 Tax=Sediminivirga luteola TaxID=1774748 RepID=A0A8J2U055_9MICO|nr:response regulator transcription factor [Sediminivirga luteola]GGA23240.1 DNA-binding response regulator [Sediminivirga luteola]
MIRLVVADDQPLVRRALRAYAAQAADIDVVGEAADGPAAVELTLREQADVVLMDVRMPGGDGLSATRQIVRRRPAARVVVITTFDLDEYVFGALEAGAAGFLLKDSHPDEVLAAIRAAAEGNGLVSPAVTGRVIAEFARRAGRVPEQAPGAAGRSGPGSTTPGPAVPLTGREEEVLAALAEGLSNAEIAARLVIEVGTVKTHVSNIIAKLGVRDRIQAAVWALRRPGN